MSCAAQHSWHEHQRLLYAGIPVRVAFAPLDYGLAGEVWAGLDRIDSIFNDHRDDSEIGRINAAGGGSFEISPELAAAFEQGERLEQFSGGAFRLTTGPLRRLWRLAAATGQTPHPAALAAALAAMAGDAWCRDGRTLTVHHPAVRFDFGALAKGIAVDLAMRLLAARGACHALVQCGGETACRGLSQHGQPHLLGIPDPIHPDSRLCCKLRDPGTGLSASTSANYRNLLQFAGRPCHHIYQPEAGLPADTDMVSVTVVFPSWGCNGLADGLATAGTVAGWHRLEEMAARTGAEAMALVRENGVLVRHTTPRWDALEAGPSAPPAAPSQAT